MLFSVICYSYSYIIIVTVIVIIIVTVIVIIVVTVIVIIVVFDRFRLNTSAFKTIFPSLYARFLCLPGLPVFLSFCLLVFLSFCLSVFLSSCLCVSVFLSFCLSVFLSSCLGVSVFMSFCLSVLLSLFLTDFFRYILIFMQFMLISHDSLYSSPACRLNRLLSLLCFLCIHLHTPHSVCRSVLFMSFQ